MGYKISSCLPLHSRRLKNAGMAISRSPDISSIQRTASRTLQSKSVDVTRCNGWVLRVFRLQPPTEFYYILKCLPSPNLRLLRHEQNRLQAEADVLRSLRGRSDLLVPRIIDYHTTPIPIGSVYLISGPFQGSILADIVPLSRQASSSVDRSIGKYVEQLSSVSGSSFGPVRSATGIPGSSSWSRCFASMLETVLRDGEDALISLPYEEIRNVVNRHRSCLDRITEPKLLLLEMSSEKNVVVNPSTWRISGLLDFSTAIWGDPYTSDCFYEPSLSFLEGFGKLPNRTRDERIRQYL